MSGFLGELFDGTRAQVLGRARGEGFDQAASIYLGLLSGKIDELDAKIKSGSFLSPNEQLLLSSLIGLKAQTEDELRAFLENAEG